MKKILLFLVVCCLTLNSFAISTFAAPTDVDFSMSELKAIISELGSKLEGKTALDRTEAFLTAKNYLVTDAGVDTLISVIENGQLASDTRFTEIYEVLGDITTRKEQFIFMLKLMKCFTAGERTVILDRFHNRQSIAFTANQQTAISNVFKYFNNDSTIDAIDTGNAVTGAMIASLFGIFEGHVMLTDVVYGDALFALSFVSSDFESKFNALLGDYTIGGRTYTSNDFINIIISEVNSSFPDDIKLNIKDVFTAVGIYTPKAPVPVDPGRPSPGGPTWGGIGGSFSSPSDDLQGSYEDRTNMNQYGSRKAGTILDPYELIEKIEAANQGSSSGAGTDSGWFIDGFDDCDYHWCDGLTTYLKYITILRGDYGTNNYRPDSNINREEMAAIVMRYIQKRDNVSVPIATTTSFNDDEDISPWARDSIAYLTRNEILNGYPDGSYKPRQEISREEAMAIISRVLNNKYRPASIAKDYVDHEDIGEWARWDVYYLSSLEIATGYSTGEFLPKNKITRAEVASIIYKNMCVEGVAR